MSSARTRTTQRIREKFNKKIVTRDATFDSVLETCNKSEANLKFFVELLNTMYNSLLGQSNFGQSFKSVLEFTYGGAAEHRSTAENISILFMKAGKAYATAAEEVRKVLDSTTSWFKIYDDIRAAGRARDKSRLIYDHYSIKVPKMKQAIANKQAKNPMYRPAPKKQDQLSRNERKLATATENFNADTMRCKQLINTATEEQFVRVTPIVGIICEMSKTMATAVGGNFQTFGGIADVLEAENFERMENKKAEKAKNSKMRGSASHANIQQRPQSSDEMPPQMPPKYRQSYDQPPPMGASQFDSSSDSEDEAGFIDYGALPPREEEKMEEKRPPVQHHRPMQADWELEAQKAYDPGALMDINFDAKPAEPPKQQRSSVPVRAYPMDDSSLQPSKDVFAPDMISHDMMAQNKPEPPQMQMPQQPAQPAQPQDPMAAMMQNPEMMQAMMANPQMMQMMAMMNNPQMMQQMMGQPDSSAQYSSMPTMPSQMPGMQSQPDDIFSGIEAPQASSQYMTGAVGGMPGNKPVSAKNPFAMDSSPSPPQNASPGAPIDNFTLL